MLQQQIQMMYVTSYYGHNCVCVTVCVCVCVCVCACTYVRTCMRDGVYYVRGDGMNLGCFIVSNFI